MLLVISILVVLTIGFAVRFLVPATMSGAIRYDRDPDRPAAFGPDMAWLAVRTRDTAALVEALGLVDASHCNWNSGIGSVYDAELGEGCVFVSPPVSGWCFVVGLSLPQPLGRSFVDKCTPLLVALGGRFSEVQYFSAYAPLDYYAWARMHEGRLLRAFATGDEGVVWNKGRLTREEKALGLRLFELRGVKGRRGDAGGEIILHPTEEQVFRLAARWSIDPTTLASSGSEPALGLMASTPASWRAERIKRAA